MDLSEPKLISPMLDDFAMGDPISNHHGVRCCPAMEKDSDNKYIVKIISIPASQVQLDALLLTGAYKSQGAALAYFKELSEGVIEEVSILQKLSKLEGFLPYENHQVVPMENEVGYDVYLLGRYKRSLERFFRRNNMTHLGAVNLGLDLCAAMAVCRRCGYLYVDLKPGNIFISADNEYRIGDLGFVPLSSLKYASLPDKYHSAYTAPEIKDAMSSLNETLDIYAIGLILYQAYNGGTLPFDDAAPEEPLPAPPYADYEMAEIILKACAPKPEDRWQDPMEMGQALVDYMQRNSVNDTPIIVKHEPYTPPVQHTEVPAVTQEETKETVIPETEPIDDAVLAEIMQSVSEVTEVIFEEEPPTKEDPEQEDTPSAADHDDTVDAQNDLQSDPEEAEDAASQEASEFSFIESLVGDETSPETVLGADVDYDDLPEDLSDILSAADELLSHEPPAPVIAPEPVDVPIPEPITEEAEKEEASTEPAPAQAAEDEESENEEDYEDEEDDDDEEDADDYESDAPPKKRSVKSIISACVAIVLVGLLLVGGYFFYRDYYIQSIDQMTLSGTESSLTVQLTTTVEDELLTVHCVDTFGNKTSSTVVNGSATFDSLNPNSIYTVNVEISGIHKLVGKITDSFTTPAQTNIVQFVAVTGPTDGSVLLTLTVDGQKASNWTVVYSAEGEEEQSQSFTGTMVTLNGLTTGKEYTFRITSEEGLYITGQSEMVYTPTPLVYAENLMITAQPGGMIHVTWDAPAEVDVSGWTVRCYNDAGYDQSVITDTTEVTFSDADTSIAHTVEVTAVGMSTGRQAFMTDNSLSVYDLNTSISDNGTLSITWEHEGTISDEGWLLMYTMDSSEHQNILYCDGNSATLFPVVPGSVYYFSLQSSDGATVFGGEFQLEVPEADLFNDSVYFYMSYADISGDLVLTPDVTDWDHRDLTDDSYTTSFTAGQKASIFMRSSHYDYSSATLDVSVLFVIRDESGNVVSANTQTHQWHPDLWSNGASYLDIPSIPDTPGNYNITVYYNGAYVLDLDFSVMS